jgi:hypothetical protein
VRRSPALSTRPGCADTGRALGIPVRRICADRHLCGGRST